jgi:hypothetical protein
VGVRLAASLLAAAWVVLFTLSEGAWSARQLPADARFGQVTRFQYPLVAIGKRTFRMGPGARIYNQHNLIIMPAAMPGRANVAFKLDMAGEIASIWLLTAEEVAAVKQQEKKPAATKAPDQPDDPSRLGRN